MYNCCFCHTRMYLQVRSTNLVYKVQNRAMETVQDQAIEMAWDKKIGLIKAWLIKITHSNLFLFKKKCQVWGSNPRVLTTLDLKSSPLDQLGQPGEMLSTGLEPVTFGS